jgi:hypothetical protein
LEIYDALYLKKVIKREDKVKVWSALLLIICVSEVHAAGLFEEMPGGDPIGVKPQSLDDTYHVVSVSEGSSSTPESNTPGGGVPRLDEEFLPLPSPGNSWWESWWKNFLKWLA